MANEREWTSRVLRMPRFEKLGHPPDIEVGACPDAGSGTTDMYPGMDVRIIQKDMPIPNDGFVVNVESPRQDLYQHDGIFPPSGIEYILADCRRYQETPNAVLLFHAAFIQGITNQSGTAPHAEMGGYGSLYRQHFEGINKRIREAFGDAKARLPCS